MFSKGTIVKFKKDWLRRVNPTIIVEGTLFKVISVYTGYVLIRSTSTDKEWWVAGNRVERVISQQLLPTKLLKDLERLHNEDY